MSSFFFSVGGDQVGSLEIECVVTENHEGSVDITDHPVETGADTTDHIRPKPASLKLDCVVTDYPLNSPDTSTLAQFGGALPNGTPGVIPGHAVQVYETLEDLRDQGALITVNTRLKLYDNMVIQSLSTPISKDADGSAIVFSMQLRSIRFVESQTVPIRRTSIVKGQGVTANGPQVSGKADAATQKKTLLKAGADALGNAVNAFRGIGL